MTENLMSGREAIAIAACDVSGRAHPLDVDIPQSDRIYLYARPQDEGDQFSADDLAERLDKSGVSHGVDWDRSSETYGLRFVTSMDGLPPEVGSFASSDALRAWKSWRAHQMEISSVIIDAASRAAQGREIEFLSEDRIFEGQKPRRRTRSGGERD